MDAKTSALIQHFEKGLAAYRAKRWTDAIKEFKSVLAIQPEDGPAKLFIARCTELQRRCPPDWRGVYVAESK
jgi:adenylate cyclase